MELDPDAFRALGDPVRLRILHFLLDQKDMCCAVPGEVCACDIVSCLGMAQPTVSHHMAILLRAGLVTAERRGRWMHYRVATGRFTQMASHLSAFAAASQSRAA